MPQERQLSPNQVLNDPEFRQLPVMEQVKVLRQIDPEYNKLPAPEQLRVIGINMQRFMPSLATVKAQQPTSIWTQPGILGGAARMGGDVASWMYRPASIPFTKQQVTKETIKRAAAVTPIAGPIATTIYSHMKPSWMKDLLEDMGDVAAEAGAGLTSPLNVGLLLSTFGLGKFAASAPIAIRLARASGGVFSVQQALDAVHQIREGISLYQQGKRREGRKALMAAGLDTVMAILTGREAIKEPVLGVGRLPKTEPKAATVKTERLPAEVKPDIKADIAAIQPESSLRRSLMRVPRLLAKVDEPALRKVGGDMVLQRSIDIASRDLAVTRFTYDLKAAVPAEDLKIGKMGYVIQGVADESILSAEGRKALIDIREFTRQQDATLREAYGDDLPLQDSETYLAQIWDFGSDPHHFKRMLAARTLMHDPFLQHKTIDTYKEGIEMGLKPRFDNVADVLRVRANFATVAMANRRMAELVKQAGIIMHPATAAKYGVSWWPTANAPALERAVYVGETKAGEPILVRRPVHVHPDFRPALEAVFGASWDLENGPRVLRGLELFRAASKKFLLTWSMFHHIALSEQSASIHLGLAASKALRSHIGEAASEVGRSVTGIYLLNPEWYRGLWEASREVITGKPGRPPIVRFKPELTDDAVGNALLLTTPDMESRITQMMKTNPVVAMRIAGNLQYIWDKALWDYYMQGQMLHTYESLVADELGRMQVEGGPAAAANAVTAMKRQVASFVNDAYGAQAFDRLLMSPKGRQAAMYAFLAPTWKISVLRTPLHIFERGVGRRLAARWAGGAAFSWFVATELTNYALTKWYNMPGRNEQPDKNGKYAGHFTWDNPGIPLQVMGHYLPLTDNSVNIAAGWNKDGTERYIRFGKALRDALLLFSLVDTIPTMGSATSTPIKLGSAALDHVVRPYKYHETGVQQLEQGVAAIIESGTPLALQDALSHLEKMLDPVAFPQAEATSQFMSQPAKRGVTLSRAVVAYREAMEANRPDVAELVLQAAEFNHVARRHVLYLAKMTNRREQHLKQGPAVEYDEHGNPHPVEVH